MLVFVIDCKAKIKNQWMYVLLICLKFHFSISQGSDIKKSLICQIWKWFCGILQISAYYDSKRLEGSFYTMN